MSPLHHPFLILAAASLLSSAIPSPFNAPQQGVVNAPYPSDISGIWDGQLQGEMNGELINTVATVRLDIKQEGKELIVKNTYHCFNESGAEFQSVTVMKGTYKNGEVQLKTKDVDRVYTFAVPSRGGGITSPVAVAYNYRLYGTVRFDSPFLVFDAFQKPLNTAVISGRYPKQKFGLAMDYGHNPVMTPRAITFKRFVGVMPQPAAQPKPAPPTSNPFEDEEIKEEFRNILFVQTSTQFLTPEDSKKVEQLGRALQQHASWKVILHGHTQQEGAKDKNQHLSERRAEIVRDMLIEKFQISGKRISTKGYGSSNPEVKESGPAKHLNRRVEIEIVR